VIGDERGADNVCSCQCCTNEEGAAPLVSGTCAKYLCPPGYHTKEAMKCEECDEDSGDCTYEKCCGEDAAASHVHTAPDHDEAPDDSDGEEEEDTAPQTCASYPCPEGYRTKTAEADEACAHDDTGKCFDLCCEQLDWRAPAPAPEPKEADDDYEPEDEAEGKEEGEEAVAHTAALATCAGFGKCHERPGFMLKPCKHDIECGEECDIDTCCIGVELETVQSTCECIKYRCPQGTVREDNEVVPKMIPSTAWPSFWTTYDDKCCHPGAVPASLVTMPKP